MLFRSLLLSSLLSTLSSLFAFGESGRQDLNLRPSGPKPDALAKLSYAPGNVTLPLCFRVVNGETLVVAGGFTVSGCPPRGAEPTNMAPVRCLASPVTALAYSRSKAKRLRKIRANQPNKDKGLDGPKLEL